MPRCSERDLFIVSVGSHGSKRSLCVESWTWWRWIHATVIQLTTEAGRGGEPWCWCARVDEICDPRRTIHTGRAEDGSGSRLCALRGLLRVDHLPGQEVSDTRSCPKAIFTSFTVRRGCNKVTAAECAMLCPASLMHHLHRNCHHIAYRFTFFSLKGHSFL